MWSVLRTPGVLQPFLSSLVARLPMGAMGLLLVLETQAITGSYAQAGLAAGAYGLALAVSNPLLARAVDARGHTRVLLSGATIAAAAMVALASLPSNAPFGAILTAAAVAGAAQPPIGACMRALWPTLLGDRTRQHAAYSLESVVIEVVYIFGPVVIVAGIGAWSLRAAFVACAALLVLGNFAFSLGRVSRAWLPAVERTAGLAGALAGPGVRVLVVVIALAGLSAGAVEVVVPAILTPLGERGLTGIMLGLWGIGSMIGGAVTGRYGPGARPANRLAMLLVAWGVAHGVAGLAGSAWTLGVLLLVAGVTIAPTFVCANGMLDSLAPPGTLTEAFTWLSTGLSVGLAAGSAIAGSLVEATSSALALGVCGAGALVAAVIAAMHARGALSPLRPVTASAQ